ncbi:MAG: hypothetical protein RIR25_269 [Verrucomicrobiota bacterium]|jgi:Ca-activated chloride channel family protein
MNDPRITSYALGELEGPAREQFERALAESEELQRHVSETTHFSKILGDLPMPTEQLEDEQRTALLTSCAKNQKAKHRNKKIFFLTITPVLAAAACLVLAFLVGGPGMRLGSGPWANGAYYPGSPKSERYIETQMAAAQNPEISATQAQHLMARGAEEQLQQSVVLAEADIQSLNVSSYVTNIAANCEVSAMPMAGVLQSLPRRIDMRRRAMTMEQAQSYNLSRPSQQEFNTEAYAAVNENDFLSSAETPLSTFSIDVDTASYANVRRFLQEERLPPGGAIRTEELINYFTYNYPQPIGEQPFSVNLEVSRAPWDTKRELVRIGLKGRELPASERQPANLVFLIDVSGSMNEPDKLPLLQRSLHGLVENISPLDHVAIVAYAGSSGLVLPSTPGTKKQDIIAAIENLSAGGSTHGSEGIKLAYETARENFLKEGANRVILCTDGDFNVGVTNESELQKLIEKERETGVFLSVLGFGRGNLKDSTMEMLADKGNGNYAYIDSPAEGRKVLVEQMGSTLFTIAKDVKIQVEFNPSRVAGYRLIGYENRLLAKEDFNDDKKDAGEIGAGHTVTALYEIIPAGQPIPGAPSVDPLKYQSMEGTKETKPSSNELLTVKLRYKEPDGDKSKLIEVPLVADEVKSFDQASHDFRFAAAVAAFSMKLRGSPQAGDISWDDIQKSVRASLGEDPGSYRAEFLTLVEKAKAIMSPSNPSTP